MLDLYVCYVESTSTLFSFDGEFYEQTCGLDIAMGSPLSLVVANLFMEDFESKALASSRLLHKMWKRFVDDTCVIWSHGKEELELFFLHLNNQFSSIKFTMEFECNGSFPFLDVLLSRNEDGSFSHQVFRKKTHTEQYLHVDSHHFLAQKLGVLNTLSTRALRVFYDNHLNEEKTHLLNVFFNNGYSRHQCTKAFLRAEKGPSTKKDTKDQFFGVHLPLIQGSTDKIARILRKHKVASTIRPLNTIQSSLRSVKDPVDPKNMKSVYIITCSYGTPYIGETHCSINQRIHEHGTDIKHGRTRSFALAKHADKSKHHICIQEAQVVARVSHFHHRKLREALEIEKRHNNLNRDDGWNISRSWVPVLSS